MVTLLHPDWLKREVQATKEEISMWPASWRRDLCQEESVTKDPVNHPHHYTTGKIEVIDFIEDQQLDFHLGNVVKYVCRSAHKGKPLEDLKKAAWYLQRAISHLDEGNVRHNDSASEKK